jgi:murein DD-endopeptidase MepM/ murein hydrolase activator NlpD
MVPVPSVESGMVMYSGPYFGYGNIVVVYHGNGLATYYAHNDHVLVTPGQIVSKGQQISVSDTTGKSTGPHIHYEIRKDVNGLNSGNKIDPLGFNWKGKKK